MLDGARALALPTRRGQTLAVKPAEEPLIRWRSLDHEGHTWFEGVFDSSTGRSLERSDSLVGDRLSDMLAAGLPPSDARGKGWSVTTRLEFPRSWGLGSSSTLIYCLASWLQVDPFVLSDQTLGGSGYDIAAAGAHGPIFYQRNHPPRIEEAPFFPPFRQNLYFVYLGQKQDSRAGIARYKSLGAGKSAWILEISALSEALAFATNLPAFEELLRRHEAIVGRALRLESARDRYFQDFWGEVKSLGAWGGDFVLVTSDRPEEETRHYFNERGFGVFLNYDSLILSSEPTHT